MRKENTEERSMVSLQFIISNNPLLRDETEPAACAYQIIDEDQSDQVVD